MAKEPGESEGRSSTAGRGVGGTVARSSGAAEGGAETEGEGWTGGGSETRGRRADERDGRRSGVEPTPGGGGDASAYTVTIACGASDEAGKALDFLPVIKSPMVGRGGLPHLSVPCASTLVHKSRSLASAKPGTGVGGQLPPSSG